MVWISQWQLESCLIETLEIKLEIDRKVTSIQNCSSEACSWFCTGDEARIDRTTGHIYIVDHVKNVFKLAQGEYVTPEKIENLYLSSISFLTQCFAHGECHFAERGHLVPNQQARKQGAWLGLTKLKNFYVEVVPLTIERDVITADRGQVLQCLDQRDVRGGGYSD